jgi:hypothetical protein
VQILVVVATILERLRLCLCLAGGPMSMRTKSLNLEGRSGEGFLVNGNQTRVSRS